MFILNIFSQLNSFPQTTVNDCIHPSNSFIKINPYRHNDYAH